MKNIFNYTWLDPLTVTYTNIKTLIYEYIANRVGELINYYFGEIPIRHPYKNIDK